MLATSRPLRSVLYIPASRTRAMEKARTLATDAIIFDLEDAVSPQEKAAAREALAASLGEGGYGPRMKIVRINGLDTEWGAEDARAVARLDCDAVLLPKVDGPERIADLAKIVGQKPIWAMMETPRGILNAEAVADLPEVEGFVLGTNDLAKEIGARVGPGRAELLPSLHHCLLAARAAGIACIDGVFNAFKDEQGLREECAQGRAMGMDGKTLIHPAQLSVANEVFGPSEDELDLARRHIEAYDAAIANGEAVAVVDGRIVENLHVEVARAQLARAEAIAKLEAA